VDLRRVVQEALTLVRVTVPAGIEIKQSYPPSPAVVLADATELHQVVMNLCSNAAHAMRAHGGVLSVSIEAVQLTGSTTDRFPQLPAGPYHCLTVRDTGHGMTPEIRERIFDPFFTTKEAGEGTGMGLAVVLGIVEGLGGRIAIESQPGVGTSFEIALPRANVTPPTGSKPILEPVGGTGRVLLVDDETFILNWASILLRRLGYEVETFSNSIEALERFRADPGCFDVVVTDQTMPRLTGAELTANALALRPDLPVIIISGFSDQLDEEHARELGARDFLLKPFSNAQLADALRRALTTDATSSPV
jgi:CheY-like chemotaxis protein